MDNNNYLIKLLGFPCGSAGKESTCNMGDLGSVPGLRRSPGEGKGYPLKYSRWEYHGLYGVTKSQIAEQLSVSVKLLGEIKWDVLSVALCNESWLSITHTLKNNVFS